MDDMQMIGGVYSAACVGAVEAVGAEEGDCVCSVKVPLT